MPRPATHKDLINGIERIQTRLTVVVLVSVTVSLIAVALIFGRAI